MTSLKRALSVFTAVATLGTLVTVNSEATTSSTTIAVSATVLSFCSISALPLTFGNYSSVALAATTTVTTDCTSGTTYNIGLDNGIAPAPARLHAR